MGGMFIYIHIDFYRFQKRNGYMIYFKKIIHSLKTDQTAVTYILAMFWMVVRKIKVFIIIIILLYHQQSHFSVKSIHQQEKKTEEHTAFPLHAHDLSIRK